MLMKVDKYVHEFALLCKINECHGHLALSIRVKFDALAKRASRCIVQYYIRQRTTFGNQSRARIIICMMYIRIYIFRAYIHLDSK
jgi:hypothetical protein